MVDCLPAAGPAKAEGSTTVAVVFTPDPPDEASPWGIFYIPMGYADAKGLEETADAMDAHDIQRIVIAELLF